MSVRRVSMGLAALSAMGVAVLAASTAANAAFVDDFSGSTLNPRWTVGTGASATVTLDTTNQWVNVTAAANNYGELIAAGGEQANFFQADVNNVNDVTGSWSPSIAIYADANNWVKLEVRGGAFYSIRDYNGTGGTSTKFTSAGSANYNTWYTLKIVLNRTTGNAEFYTGPQGGPLTLQSALTQNMSSQLSSSTSPYLILGKGYVNSSNNNPYFENDYTGSAGTTGTSYYDNANFNTVPEPATLGVLALGGLLLIRRRRTA